jgi:hypothetical protein
MCLAPVIALERPASKGQESLAQGLRWVSRPKRFALKGPGKRSIPGLPPREVNGARLTEEAKRGRFAYLRGGQSARFFLFAFLAILLQSCAENSQAVRTLTDRNISQTGQAPAFAGSRRALPILMVGDSLTVGGFGEAVEEYLLRRFGTNHVAIFACCGSSPEHWLRSGPEYITKCGYREQTPRSSIVYDFERGRRPRRVRTPKLEDLMAKFRPKTVIVQLGTNWMDGMHSNPTRDESTYGEILDRFVAAIQSEPDTVRKIIWITPPDSSRYSKAVQMRVTNLIKRASRRHSFEIIDSSRLTHYVRGQSGSDGVHYNSAAAKEWANRVTKELDSMLR